MSAPASFGVIGLGTMGSNLALNLADHGARVAVWNLERERVDGFLAEHPERGFVPAATFAELAGALERPRRILLMIPAGDPVEQTLRKLAPVLEPGDVVIDGGNSNFRETRRRAGELAARGLHLVGLGVSGGSEGARHGPSLMPGCTTEAYAAVRAELESIAARTAAGPCVAWLGTDGAGHFVKMVHNGIEYADMQAIAEAYDVLRRGLGLAPDAVAARFAEWNRGDLESFLIEITAEILAVADPETGAPLVDRVLDEAEQKGTGRWTATTALELGVPTPSIVAAVDARVLSSRREERVAASGVLRGPDGSIPARGLEDPVAAAVYASRICAFAQGMDLIRGGSAEYGWAIPRDEVARIWMGGCIIRARLLGPIREAFADPELPNLLLDPGIAARLDRVQTGWRRAIAAAAVHGIPTPCWTAALAYYDAYRNPRLPQNLTQAQRDAFGAHTYRRLDDPDGAPIHTDWLARAPAQPGTR